MEHRQTPEYLPEQEWGSLGDKNTITVRNMRCLWNRWRQARRDGEIMGSFPGPRYVWGFRHRSKLPTKVFQMASFWNQISMKSVFRPGSAPDTVGKLTTLTSQTLCDGEGTPSHVSFLSTPSASLDAFGVSMIDLGAYGIKALREWFPGPRCGCRQAWGPGMKIERTLLLTAYRRSIE